MKKSNVAWSFVVGILSLLLILSVILGMSGYYFSVNYLNSKSDIMVGNSFSISVKPNEANLVCFTIDGGYLPNEVIPQTIHISGEDLNKDAYIRVKARVFGVPNVAELDFVTTEHFEKQDDGYYYFDDVLKGGNKVTFATYLLVPPEIDLASNEKYILSIVVESLESNVDVENIWKNV